MQLNPIPKDSYGVFYKGDTYLIFCASETSNKTLAQHIHLWIGEESTNVSINILQLHYNSTFGINGLNEKYK